MLCKGTIFVSVEFVDLQTISKKMEKSFKISGEQYRNYMRPKKYENLQRIS